LKIGIAKKEFEADYRGRGSKKDLFAATEFEALQESMTKKKGE